MPKKKPAEVGAKRLNTVQPAISRSIAERKKVRRHARHARADASRSGIHASGEECAMPAWVHSEWRLLHAYVPACSGSRPEGRAVPEQLRADSQLLR